MYKSPGEVRREGERAFERNHYGHENPYDRYDGYDEQQHHREWDDGFRAAERRDEERRAEQEREERERERRHYEAERQRQAAEQEHYEEIEAQRQEEEARPAEEEVSELLCPRCTHGPAPCEYAQGMDEVMACVAFEAKAEVAG